ERLRKRMLCAESDDLVLDGSKRVDRDRKVEPREAALLAKPDELPAGVLTRGLLNGGDAIDARDGFAKQRTDFAQAEHLRGCGADVAGGGDFPDHPCGEHGPGAGVDARVQILARPRENDAVCLPLPAPFRAKTRERFPSKNANLQS